MRHVADNNIKNDIKWLAGIFALAFGIRLAFLWFWEAHDLESVFHHDEYVNLAQYWLGWLPNATEVNKHCPGPGFSFVCALLFKAAGGPNFFLVRIANVFFSSATSFLIGYWVISMRNASARARITAFLVALSPSLIFYSSHLQSESFFIFLQMLFFLCLSRYWEIMSHKSAFCLGLFAGLLSLTRPVFTFFLPFLLLTRLIWQMRQQVVMIRPLALLSAGWIIPISLWALSNWVNFHRFIPLTVQSGCVFYVGIATNPEERYQRMISMRKEVDALKLKSYIDQDRYFMRKGLKLVREHPFKFGKVFAIKLFQFWRPSPYPPYPKVARIGLGIYFSQLFLLAVVGTWKLRERFLEFLPMYAYFVCLTVTHSFFDTAIRYRVPLDPFICFLASVGIMGIVDRFKNPQLNNASDRTPLLNHL